MQITARDVGKKFVAEWIIRRVGLDFHTGQSYTFVGPNGSGKSTLIQLLTGMVPTSEGTIKYLQSNGQELDIDAWYKYLVLAAPYLELIEEFTLRELVDFHRRFKPLKNNATAADFEDFVQLTRARHKLIRHFSSGMKQRVKLGLAFLSDVPVVFLDEPTSNLDAQGIRWYLDHVTSILDDQLLILGSNQPQEYAFCENIISVSAFK